MSGTIRWLGVLLCAAVSGISSGCAGGNQATSGTSDISPGVSPETILNAPPVFQKIVGKVELGAPAATAFILRATIPLPPATYPSANGLKSFGFVEPGGNLVAAQVEIVSRYPKTADGADIVELLARVHRDAKAKPGDRIQFDVAEVLYNPGQAPTGATIGELLEDGLVSQKILDAVTSPNSIYFRARDASGNLYTMDPIHPDGGWATKRLGTTAIQVRSSGTMAPTKDGSGSQPALTHLFAVNAYITAWRGEELLSLDVRFHNGWIGSNPATPAPLVKSYFQSLEILVPNGWTIQQDFTDANLGEPYDAGEFTAYPLVKPSSDGKMHLFPAQGQYERRLVLAPVGAESKAKFFLAEEGLAFAQPGQAGDGSPLYSWWNPETARYFAQKAALPVFDFTTAASIRAGHAYGLAKLSAGIASGVAIVPGEDYKNGALGIANPFWNEYGGVTGGSWIHALAGETIAWAASREGYQLEQLRHRMNVDRQPVALYREDGEAACVEDFLKKNGAGMSYVPFEFDHKPNGSSGKAFFGITSPPTVQTQIVESGALQPAYEAKLLQYQPHDAQHLIRFTRGAKILATLGNDAMAKDNLKLEAELFRLSYNEYPQSSTGSFKKNGLLGHKDFVAKYPAKGFEYHRGEAWGTDASAIAYAMGDEAYRAKVLPWFQQLTDVLRDGQAGCGRGSIMAIFNAGKIFTLYRGLQTYEECFVQNALRGMLHSVLEGKDPARAEQMKSILAKTYLSLISQDSWDPSNIAPYTRLAIGPEDPSLPIFCAGTVPADGKTVDLEKEEIWIGLFGGLDLLSDPIFAEKAQILAGGSLSKLQTALQSSDEGKLANFGWMLAKMQQLGWSTQP